MKNFFKNYFKGFCDNDYPFWKVMVIVLPIAILFTTYMDEWSKNHPTKYDTYEILIVDKYDDIGSTWHLIGGRASETEYHIVYKYCNRTKNTSWRDNTRTVNGTTYHKYNIGDRFKVKQIEGYISAPYLP